MNNNLILIRVFLPLLFVTLFGCQSNSIKSTASNQNKDAAVFVGKWVGVADEEVERRWVTTRKADGTVSLVMSYFSGKRMLKWENYSGTWYIEGDRFYETLSPPDSTSDEASVYQYEIVDNNEIEFVQIGSDTNYQFTDFRVNN